MSELLFSLLCFNINRKSNRQSIIDYLSKGKFHICFLQEIPKSEVKTYENSAKSYYRDILQTHGYDAIYLQEGQGSQPCNCLFYKKSEFSVVKIDEKPYALDKDADTDDRKPDILKEFEAKLVHGGHDHDKLKNRACLVMLQYTGSGSSAWNPRIIVVSIHNPYKVPNDVAQSNPTQLFSALDYLGQTIGCPVLVAGDFNCELLKMKVNTRGFIVPSYNPTIHRVHKNRIDFFAYKNYVGCTEIELDNVHADLVLKDDCLVKGNGGQYYLDHKYAGEWSSILQDIDSKVSDHDPLRATLTVKPVHVLPTLTISYYNVNNNQNATDYLAKINHTSDCVILNNIDIEATPERLSCHYSVKKQLAASTVFYYNQLKFLSKHDILGQSISYLDNNNLKIILAFIHKVADKGINMKDEITKILSEAGHKAVIVMGDFNSAELPADLPLVVEQCESPPYIWDIKTY